MKNRLALCSPLVLSAFVVFCGARNGNAASVFASAYAAEGNQQFGRILGSYGSQTGSTTAVAVDGAGGSTHNLEQAGGTGDLVFEGSASASATYFSLRAEAAGSVSNAFLDPAYDHDAETGIPTAYFSQGTANFSQTLQYGGTAHSYTSIYALRLTGTVSGTGRAAVSVSLNHASEPAQDWFYSVEGSYDLIIYSRAYVHGAFAQEFSLSVNTLYSFDMDFLQPGGSYAGSADFGSTLEVIGIDLRDENGLLQPQGTISSDSGHAFEIISAPEPTSLLLSAVAILGAYAKRRR